MLFALLLFVILFSLLSVCLLARLLACFLCVCAFVCVIVCRKCAFSACELSVVPVSVLASPCVLAWCLYFMFRCFLLCGSALRVPPAETRLTVYRRLDISSVALQYRQAVAGKCPACQRMQVGDDVMFSMHTYALRVFPAETRLTVTRIAEVFFY